MGNEITPIVMPKWGLAMREGKLAAWLVEEGADITVGTEIMDVETDKIANAVEAADPGILRRRIGEVGKVYPVRSLLGIMAPETVTDAEIDAFIQAYDHAVSEGEGEDASPAYSFAELSVGRIRYAARAGDATPVVLIHGFGGDLDNWLFNIDALAAAHPVYALDLPGHGQSVKPQAEADLELLVRTVKEFLASLGLERAHLVGHSMGGLVAARVAIEEPQTVASVSLICSAGLGEEINSAYIDGFIRASGRKDLKAALELLFFNPELVGRTMVDDVLKYKRLDGVSGFLVALGGKLFAQGRQAVVTAQDLQASEVPVCVIWGAEDAVIPAAHAGAIPSAATHVLEGAGHMVQLEKASEVNSLLLAHFG